MNNIVWRYKALKTKILTPVLLAAVLFSPLVSCSAKTSSLLELVKLLPNNTNAFVYINVGIIAKDPDLADTYRGLQDKMAELEEDYGIALPNVRLLAIAYYMDGATLVIKGNFDPNSVRNALRRQEDDNFTEDEYYKDVEIWRGKDYTVTFPKGMFVMGSSLDTVKGIIDLSQGEGLSLYDDDHVKPIVDRLPDGINTLMAKGGVVHFVRYLAGGISFMKSTDTEGTLRIRGCYKFESAADAEASLASLEDYVTNAYNATNVGSQLNGEFIELTGETEANPIQFFF